MKSLIFSLFCIFSCSLVTPLGAQNSSTRSPVSASPRFVEAMAVCDNMGVYVQSAQRQAAAGMPKEMATEMISDLMNKNLKIEDQAKAAAINLVMTIYSYVYAEPQQRIESIETVLSKTCASYRDYNLPQEQVDIHLANTTPSAWNPMVRVPLCTNLAQSAANIATARDRGIPRNKIGEVAAVSLSNDKFTLSHLPDIIGAAYDNPGREVAFIYGESLGRCKSRESQRDYPPAALLWEQYSRCTSASQDKDAIRQCRQRVLQIE